VRERVFDLVVQLAQLFLIGFCPWAISVVRRGVPGLYFSGSTGTSILFFRNQPVGDQITAAAAASPGQYRPKKRYMGRMTRRQRNAPAAIVDGQRGFYDFFAGVLNSGSLRR
jgi:hypothetical protein